MAKSAKSPVKTPGKAGGGGLGPKTPQMKPKTPNKPGKTPVPQMGKSPKNKTPKPAPGATPKMNKTPKPLPQQTPKTKTPIPQPDTPRPPKVATPAQNGASGHKAKPLQQQRQQQPPQQHNKSPKDNKQQGNTAKSQSSQVIQARTVRLTFPQGALKSLEQVKQMVPTASTIKFPNVVFVEFATEAEADRQHAKLRPLITDGQLNMVNYVGEKERLQQVNNRGVDPTRLFLRRIGNATEVDIKKLFPTSTTVLIRGGGQGRNRSHNHKYCFVVFATAAACSEAMEKSKGLTLFGEALLISHAYMRKGPDGDVADVAPAAEKRPAADATDAPAPAKKAKQAAPAKPEEDDDDDEEDEDEEDEEGEDEEDDDDEDGDEEEDDDDDDEDEEGDDDDDDDDEDDDDDDDE